jgi:hypothetical protein
MGRPRKNPPPNPSAASAPESESATFLSSDALETNEVVLNVPVQNEGKAAGADSAKSVSVRSKSASFWRCGRQFTKQPTVFSANELSDDEILRLMSEPLLIVEVAK